MGDLSLLSEISDAFTRREVDPSVTAVLPDLGAILRVQRGNTSAWAQAFRIDVLGVNGGQESYFIKISIGFHGLQALKGEYEATSAIYAITPDFCPKPIAWGSLHDHSDAHFYLCKFYEFSEDLPEPNDFCEKLARLHSSHSSPEGKFGFHCTTYNGDLPQDNTWCDSWEAFFANGLRHILKVREERAGPSPELEALCPALFEKVIPRLLRPLESNGRQVQPSLVHGDLWYGNAAVIEETGASIIFDPSSFWAHYEYEFGNWRPARNRFTSPYFEAYKSHIADWSDPVTDFDDRNALYALRFNLHAATLFPDNNAYLQMAVDEIRRLTEKFPEGYVEDSGNGASCVAA